MTKPTASLKIWFMALRPKTLTAAVAPMMIGTAMAVESGGGHVPIAVVCLLTALLLQIGTNIANDYYDFQKGVDSVDRIGPTRVTQAGLLAPATVRLGFIVCFALAAVGWAILTVRGGWIVAVLGVASILSGIFYTAGPKPLGYLGLGEVFVFIFFGPVAVTGCYYVQTLSIPPAAVLAGIGPGLLSTAILTVNNLRDVQSDRRSGKKTLAVRFGVGFARMEYLLAILGAALMPIIIYLQAPGHPWLLLASFSCLAALPVIRVVLTRHEGPALNRALAQTGALLLGYSVVFSAAWLWG